MWYIRNYTAPEEHYLHIIITLTKPSTPFTFKEMSPIKYVDRIADWNDLVSTM